MNTAWSSNQLQRSTNVKIRDSDLYSVSPVTSRFPSLICSHICNGLVCNWAHIRQIIRLRGMSECFSNPPHHVKTISNQGKALRTHRIWANRTSPLPSHHRGKCQDCWMVIQMSYYCSWHAVPITHCFQDHCVLWPCRFYGNMSVCLP